MTLEVTGPQESVVVETTAGADPLKLESAATGGTLLDIPVRELPATLTIVSQELMQERASRWNRWLYHGFHSLDFPSLYYKRHSGTSS
jgi:hypothetical protein